MRHLLLALFSTIIFQGYAQIICLTSQESFQVLNSADSAKYDAVWLDLSHSQMAHIRIASGKILKRTFPKEIDKPFYVIETEKVWYRPNSKMTSADTLNCLPLPEPEKPNKGDSLITGNRAAQFNEWLAEIQALEFEYEKSERIIEVLKVSYPFACEELQQLLNCLQYPQSKVDILKANKSTFSADCLEGEVSKLPKELRKTIDIDE